MDPGRDRREAARRQGARRPRRPPRAGPGAGARALREPRRATCAAGCPASTGSWCRSTSRRWPRCSAARCRPRPASAGTAPCTRPRPPRRWAGCWRRSRDAGAEPWVHSLRRRRPRWPCCAAPGARGLSVDLGRRSPPPTTTCWPRRWRRGRRCALGVVPVHRPRRPPPTDTAGHRAGAALARHAGPRPRAGRRDRWSPRVRAGRRPRGPWARGRCAVLARASSRRRARPLADQPSPTRRGPGHTGRAGVRGRLRLRQPTWTRVLGAVGGQLLVLDVEEDPDDAEATRIMPAPTRNAWWRPR